jgi:hypothetical protein
MEFRSAGLRELEPNETRELSRRPALALDDESELACTIHDRA